MECIKSITSSWSRLSTLRKLTALTIGSIKAFGSASVKFGPPAAKAASAVVVGTISTTVGSNEIFKELFHISPLEEIGGVIAGEQTWPEAKSKIVSAM